MSNNYFSIQENNKEQVEKILKENNIEYEDYIEFLFEGDDKLNEIIGNDFDF